MSMVAYLKILLDRSVQYHFSHAVSWNIVSNVFEWRNIFHMHNIAYRNRDSYDKYPTLYACGDLLIIKYILSKESSQIKPTRIIIEHLIIMGVNMPWKISKPIGQVTIS